MECGHLGAFDHTVPATRGHQVGQTCHSRGNCCEKVIVRPYRGKYGYPVVKIMVFFVSIFLPLFITTFSVRV